jgi:ABC-type enterobactin transport system permease subunit
MKRWKITFETGAIQTVMAGDIEEARRKVVSKLGAWRLPVIFSIVLLE